MQEDFIDLGDLKAVEVKFKIGGARYVLRECPEGDACTWRSFQAKMARFTEDGKFAGVGNIADSQPLLVSFCLFRADQRTGEVVLTDGDDPKPDLNHRVSLAVVRSWPARLVRPLFDRAKEISGLDEKEDAKHLWKRLDDAAGKLLRLLVDRTVEEGGPLSDADARTMIESAVRVKLTAAVEALPKNSQSATTATSD